MAYRDLYHETRVSQSLAPAARVTGTFQGSAVDLRGFDAALVTVSFGDWTDGTHTPSLQHSVDGTVFADCAEADLEGSFSPVSSASDADAAQSVGYIGARRFVRVVMTVAGANAGALSGASVTAGYPHIAPVA